MENCPSMDNSFRTQKSSGVMMNGIVQKWNLPVCLSLGDPEAIRVVTPHSFFTKPNKNPFSGFVTIAWTPTDGQAVYLKITRVPGTLSTVATPLGKFFTNKNE